MLDVNKLIQVLSEPEIKKKEKVEEAVTKKPTSRLSKQSKTNDITSESESGFCCRHNVPAPKSINYRDFQRLKRAENKH